MPFAFIRHGDRTNETEDIYLMQDKMFEDALFNFVYQTLGYRPVEIKGKDIEIKEV